ncbi:hypothetical protein GQ600_5456 [Phytophthora cactorum]|nr:hypothetical protein GQ600_5456 [Phytophthora cactorum]
MKTVEAAVFLAAIRIQRRRDLIGWTDHLTNGYTQVLEISFKCIFLTQDAQATRLAMINPWRSWGNLIDSKVRVPVAGTQVTIMCCKPRPDRRLPCDAVTERQSKLSSRRGSC